MEDTNVEIFMINVLMHEYGNEKVLHLWQYQKDYSSYHLLQLDSKFNI